MFRRLSSTVVTTVLALFVVTAFVDYNEATTPTTTVVPWIDTSDRDAVVAAYRSFFEREVPAMAWTGQLDQCRPGESSEELRQETLIRVSYYRAMAGVPSLVVDDPEMSRRAQAAALMMSAEGELTHHPDADFACYSDDGRLAAANSNLYLGRTGPTAIDGYIEDPGDGNIDVGHRNTILHPPTRYMGVGHVAATDDHYQSNALWVFDDDVFDDDYQTRETERFVAWPPRGYVPREVVYPRWSFALEEAGFDSATVTMELDGAQVPLEVIARISKDGEIPSSVIVWEPDPAFLVDGEDQAVTVTVSGVEPPPGDGTGEPALVTFRYDVTVLGGPADGGSPFHSVVASVTRAATAVLGSAPISR